MRDVVTSYHRLSLAWRKPRISLAGGCIPFNSWKSATGCYRVTSQKMVSVLQTTSSNAFHWKKGSHFDNDFTSICFWESIWQWLIFGKGNDLGLHRRQAITWTYIPRSLTHVCVTRPQYANPGSVVISREISSAILNNANWSLNIKKSLIPNDFSKSC